MQWVAGYLSGRICPTPNKILAQTCSLLLLYNKIYRSFMDFIMCRNLKTGLSQQREHPDTKKQKGQACILSRELNTIHTHD